MRGRFGKVLDEIVELPLPSQRPGDEVGGQRAIALILKRGPDRRESRRQIGAAGIHVAQRGERGCACGRDHRALGRQEPGAGLDAPAGEKLTRGKRAPPLALQHQQSQARRRRSEP